MKPAKPRGMIFAAELIPSVMSGAVTMLSVLMKPQPEGYPKFYSLPVQFGIALFADEGEHKGFSLGHFYAPTLHLYGAENFSKHGGLAWQKNHDEHEEITCPFGVGERRYVKEAWYCDGRARLLGYPADGDCPHGEPYRIGRAQHMPVKFARTWIEITGVRPARCQEITEEEAIASGLERAGDSDDPDGWRDFRRGYEGSVWKPELWREAYAVMWNQLIARSGYEFSANPWTWRCTLRLATEKGAAK